MSIWSWITGKVVAVEEVQPVIKEGEDIVKDLMEIISDLKGKRFGEVVGDTKQIAKDVAEFAAEVEKIIGMLKPVEAAPVAPVQQ